MGNEAGELMHFIHISDSHLSSFESERTEAFNRFCSQTIKRVNPSFVIHTGDLTDGKGSKGDWTQQEIDWKIYRKTLEVTTLTLYHHIPFIITLYHLCSLFEYYLLLFSIYSLSFSF